MSKAQCNVFIYCLHNLTIRFHTNVKFFTYHKNFQSTFFEFSEIVKNKLRIYHHWVTGLFF